MHKFVEEKKPARWPLSGRENVHVAITLCSLFSIFYLAIDYHLLILLILVL